MIFEQFKRSPLATEYPATRYSIPVDRSAWINDVTAEAMRKLAEPIAPGRVIIELGSFLGAGSTHTFLSANERIKLICVDTWACDPKNVDPSVWPNGKTPFFEGDGSAWQHFVNNTWEYRSRVAPVKADASAMCLRMLYATGLDVALVFLDADHCEYAVHSQLTTALALWPRAVIALDDYHPLHPGVMRAVRRAMRDGAMCDSDIVGQHDRLLIVQKRREQWTSPLH